MSIDDNNNSQSVFDDFSGMQEEAQAILDRLEFLDVEEVMEDSTNVPPRPYDNNYFCDKNDLASNSLPLPQQGSSTSSHGHEQQLSDSYFDRQSPSLSALPDNENEKLKEAEKIYGFMEECVHDLNSCFSSFTINDEMRTSGCIHHLQIIYEEIQKGKSKFMEDSQGFSFPTENENHDRDTSTPYVWI